MAKVYADFENQVKGLVKDTHLVSNLALYIEHGMRLYEERCPRLVVVELTGDGNTYAALPTSGQGWEAGYSNIFGIEYPIDQTPPEYMAGDQWMIQKHPTLDRIKWIKDYPINAEKFWVTFTARHTLAGGGTPSNTIPDGDFAGACYAMAHVYARALAQFYGGETVPTMEADSVNHQSKAMDFKSLAKSLLDDFHNLVPIRGHSVFTDWDRTASDGGTLLTHDEMQG